MHISTHLRNLHARTGASGSALMAALIMIGIVAFIAATVLSTAIPAYRSTYHASAWHEARLAADAGIELGVAAVQDSIQPGTNNYTWPGWTKPDGSAFVPGTDGVRVLVPAANLLQHSGDGSVKPAILRVEVDVITRDDNISKNPWYRIRATGSAEIASHQLGLDKRDVFLRRISMSNSRVTRTVEVLTRPIYLWEYALKTAGSMQLGGGSTWVIDSYDSRYSSLTADHRGSIGGMYHSSMAGAFGNIASDLERPAGSPYGMLIDAEGAVVRGEVQTHGGDDPTTPQYENIEEGENIEVGRITSEFDENLRPPENPLSPYVPATGETTPPPVIRIVDPVPWQNANAAGSTVIKNPGSIVSPSIFSTTPGSAGTTIENPVRLLYNTSSGFTLPTSPDGNPRFVDIVINSNLNVGPAGLTVPPNVHARVFLNGDLSFGNRDINYSSSSSRVPGNLQMYGVAAPGTNPTVGSAGNGHIVAVFYGPQYAGGLDGNTEIVGSFVLKNYGIQGGGGSGGDSVGAGFHYDEALGVVGPIQEYKVVSYFEDFRRDIE
jgi:hypothetical protein